MNGNLTTRGSGTAPRLSHKQENEGSTPSPANFPSIAQQEAYWTHLPEYECPCCGAWLKVGTIEDELTCPCGGRLIVARDGELRNGLWRDLTKLVAQ